MIPVDAYRHRQLSRSIISGRFMGLALQFLRYSQAELIGLIVPIG